MTLVSVYLDWRPGYWGGEHTAGSLLLAPAGAGTVLELLRQRRGATDSDDTIIVPNFPIGGDYVNAIQATLPDARVVAVDRFLDALDGHEPSDALFVLDARSVPGVAWNVSSLLRAGGSRTPAVHGVHLRRSSGGAHECVVFGEDRRVRAIQRLYDGVTQIEVGAVSCSLVSVAAIRRTGLSRLSLADLRKQLSAGGIPSRDITTHAPAFDLTEEEGLLALNEHLLVNMRNGGAPGLRAVTPSVWVGAGCEVHPHSRLCGPVILHSKVRVDADAVVIGPTVAGRGAHVGVGAVVSRSVLAENATVEPRARVAHCVLSPARSAAARVAPLDAAWEPSEPGLLGELDEFEVADGAGSAVYGGWAAGAGKRAFDVVAALLGLVLLSPLLLVVALLIKLTSRGPLLFGHEREGRGGREFRCWKFRTMIDRAHARQRALYRQSMVDGPQFKLPDDPRVTRVGRWLRATNLDEIPQLYNVLRGEMSLCGPRPSPFRENQICVPWRNARLSVRPGITGLWQVCRHDRSTGDFHQWIYFDLLYVRHMSPGLDMRILIATLLTMGGKWHVPLRWMIRTEAPREIRAAQMAS